MKFFFFEFKMKYLWKLISILFLILFPEPHLFYLSIGLNITNLYINNQISIPTKLDNMCLRKTIPVCKTNYPLLKYLDTGTVHKVYQVVGHDMLLVRKPIKKRSRAEEELHLARYFDKSQLFLVFQTFFRHHQ